jgi:hypothetical protein
MVDEGAGRVRVLRGLPSEVGIYRQTDDSLRICFCDARDGRPRGFQGGDGVHHLLTLHRVRPRR